MEENSNASCPQVFFLFYFLFSCSCDCFVFIYLFTFDLFLFCYISLNSFCAQVHKLFWTLKVFLFFFSVLFFLFKELFVFVVL